MKKGVKIAIGIATIGVVGVGGYFLYKKVIQPKLEKRKRDREELPPDDDNLSTASNNIQKSPSNKVPFTNTTEGNAFRKWVNKNYPDYAKKLFGDGLGLTGSYNNKYVQDAWKNYGAEYQEDIAEAKEQAERIANRIKIGDYVMTNNTGLNTKKQLTYNGCSQFKGRNYAIPNNVKFQVCWEGRDQTNGRRMIRMYNKGYKNTKYYPLGMGFMVYADYVKKVKFAED